MKKIFTLILMMMLFFGLTACNELGVIVDDGEKTPAQTEEVELEQLDTPVVTIDKKGVASWKKIKNADGYAYKINGGEELFTEKAKVQLELGDSIKVKALGDGEEYEDSKYSKTVSYELEKTETPVQTETHVKTETKYPEEEDFEAWLNENYNSIDVKDLDKLFSSDEYISYDKIANIEIPSVNLEVLTSGEANDSPLAGFKGSIWQDDKNIYFYNQKDNELAYFNLYDLVEILKNIMPEYLLNSPIANVIYSQYGINLGAIMNACDLYITDFARVDSSTYTLKTSAIARIIATLTDHEVSEDELVEMLGQFAEFKIDILFYDRKVRGLEVNVVLNNEVHLDFNAMIEFQYDYDGIDKIYGEVNFTVEDDNNAITLHADTNVWENGMGSFNVSTDIEFYSSLGGVENSLRSTISFDNETLYFNIDAYFDNYNVQGDVKISKEDISAYLDIYRDGSYYAYIGMEVYLSNNYLSGNAKIELYQDAPGTMTFMFQGETPYVDTNGAYDMLGHVDANNLPMSVRNLMFIALRLGMPIL